MDFHEVLQARRSIRTFFPRPIEMEKIGAILQAASHAPSVGDLKPWKFIVVTKARQLQAIADSCPYEKWLYQAPLVIVVCTQQDRAETFYPGYGRLWASQSCAAAAQNMLLTAVDLELAGCWVSSFEVPKLKENLHIPDGVEPEILIAIGYPDEDPPKQKFQPYDSYVYFNDYGAANVDSSFYKKDFGLYFRSKYEDVQTHAAYATAERGGLRMQIERFQEKLRGAFKRKGDEPKQPSRSDVADHGKGMGHVVPERENVPTSPVEGENYQHKRTFE
jgi:nitroreductase